MTKLLSGKIIIDRNESEIVATIRGKLYRGTPMDVDDPTEIDNLTATDEAGNVVELTEEESEQATAQLLEAA